MTKPNLDWLKTPADLFQFFGSVEEISARICMRPELVQTMVDSGKFLGTQRKISEMAVLAKLKEDKPSPRRMSDQLRKYSTFRVEEEHDYILRKLGDSCRQDGVLELIRIGLNIEAAGGPKSDSTEPDDEPDNGSLLDPVSIGLKLTEQEQDIFTDLGNGNRSRGLRRLIRRAVKNNLIQP